MSVGFNPLASLVAVDVAITGPTGTITITLALDTGATNTIINHASLSAIGYRGMSAAGQFQVTMGSGPVRVPRISVMALTALGQQRTQFPVLVHTLPATLSVDGVLGLDFLRGNLLTIDFRTGQIALT